MALQESSVWGKYDVTAGESPLVALLNLSEQAELLVKEMKRLNETMSLILGALDAIAGERPRAEK